MQPTKEVSSAALTIQRAWRASESLSDLAKTFNALSFDHIRAERFSSVDLSIILQLCADDNFRVWLLKLLYRGGSTKDPREVTQRVREIAYCWPMVVAKELWPEDSPLIRAATSLVDLFLDLHSGDFEHLVFLELEVNDYLDELDRWMQHDAKPFSEQLRNDILEFLHSTVFYHTGNVNGMAFSLKRLLTLYGFLFPCDFAAFEQSHVRKALHLARTNEFTACAVVHMSKILHEILINDGKYFVPLSHSFARLSAKHTYHGKILDSRSLRQDLLCCLLSFVDQVESMEKIVNAFHATLESTSAECARAFFVILKDVSNVTWVTGAMDAQWNAHVSSDPLKAIILCVQLVRNALDNAAISFTGQSMSRFISENTIAPPAMKLLQVCSSKRTKRWINALLPACDISMLDALSKGSPFALLDVFNDSVLGLVFFSDGSGAEMVVDYLSTEHCPEFLHNDRERLVDIRLDVFSVCSPAFERRHFKELVTAGKWMGPAYACTVTVQRCAEILRRVLQLHRYCHGHMLCNLIMDSATELLESSGCY